MTTPVDASPFNQRKAIAAKLDSGRWTVDNTESRFTSLNSNSPRKSILKGSRTPHPYDSPVRSILERRNLRLAERRVSFAPDAHIRWFGEEDSVSTSAYDKVRVSNSHASQHAEDSAVFDASPLTSEKIRENPFLARLTGSPGDRRKRRPDLFGSPPATSRSPKRHLAERLRDMRRRLFEDEDDDDGGPIDLTQYMANRQSYVARSIFSDDEEEPMQITGEQPVVPAVTLKEPDKPAAADEVTMELTQVVPPAHNEQIEDENVHDDGSDMIITQVLPNPATSEQLKHGEQDDAQKTEQQSSTQPSGEDSSRQHDIDHSVEQRSAEKMGKESSAQPSVEDLSRQDDVDHSVPMEITGEHLPVKSATPRRLSGPPPRITEHPFLSPIISRPVPPYSPHRSFYLHASRDVTEDHSIGSDYGDRMMSVHGGHNTNIMDEEFPEQLYDSFADETPITPIQQNIPLSDFLKFVGIEFTVDNDVGDHRRALNANTSASVSGAEQAVVAATIIPQIETYRTCCEELKEFISIDTKAVEKLDNEMSRNNPPFFREYLDGSLSVRAKMEERFKLIKKYAHLQAKKTFYEWYKPINRDLKDTLKKRLDDIEQDEKFILEFKEKMEGQIAAALSYRESLKKALREAYAKEKVYNQTDHKHLAYLQAEIKEQRESLESYRKDAKDLEKQEAELSERLKQLELRKTSLKAAIEQAKKSREAHRYLTERDLLNAKEHFEACSELGNWQLRQQTDTVTEFIMFEDINVLIDKRKLELKAPDAVLVRMLEDRDRFYGVFGELAYGLQSISRITWDLNEIAQNLVMYWQKARFVYRELRLVRARYWMELSALPFNDGDDLENRGVICTIVPVSFAYRTKIVVQLRIRPRDVLSFPAINEENLDIKLVYGPVTEDDLNTVLRKLLRDRGIVDLADTLKETLERIQVPHGSQ